MKAQWWLPDARDTQGLGGALARSLHWDDERPRLLYLSGELGAGKTTLAAALLHELGVEEAVRSPSYALIEAYPVPHGQAVHVDLYRLHGAKELQQLGLTEYLSARTLLLVEWPERAAAALPPPDLVLALTTAPDPAALGRRAQLDARSTAGEQWLAATLPAMPKQI
ncbi:MAG TPA: tRNA (adenosine(37)-N6)-threonylcarbamoyltransferase complex ATPase subunit type 1 TsaE [Steroidobacteraceae bacterium]|jgi:tRNA threonylcarbamoyladenosine biosynthesis protein TsaE